MVDRSERSGVEILCVGTELLLGNILNGNARWLSEELASLGLPHFRQTVVGDNRDRLIALVQEMANRANVLIITGGLGPTPDDLTTESIAAAFSVPLGSEPTFGLTFKKRPIAAVVPLVLKRVVKRFCPLGLRF